jgi:hypothetical protein
MTERDKFRLFSCDVVALLAYLAGLIVGAFAAEKFHQKEAIQRGFAQYHPETGEWQWKEPTQ